MEDLHVDAVMSLSDDIGGLSTHGDEEDHLDQSSPYSPP
jgi:hypothetical protein